MENMQEKIQAHEQRVRRLNGVWENFQRQQEEREQRNPRNIMFNALGGKDGRLNAPEKMNLVQKSFMRRRTRLSTTEKKTKNSPSSLMTWRKRLKKTLFILSRLIQSNALTAKPRQ